MLLSVSPVKVKSFLHLAPSKLPLTLLLWAWLETQSWLHGVWAYLASQAKFSPVSERYQTLNTGWYELSTHCAVIKQLVRAHMSCWWGKLEYRSTDGYVLTFQRPDVPGCHSSPGAKVLKVEGVQPSGLLPCPSGNTAQAQTDWASLQTCFVLSAQAEGSWRVLLSRPQWGRPVLLLLVSALTKYIWGPYSYFFYTFKGVLWCLNNQSDKLTL
jgi:hypothetical protein